MASDREEVEWQFDAPDLSAVATWLRQHGLEDNWRLHEAEPQEITDTYLDTLDWHFFRAGYVLRTRCVAGQPTEITLKSFGTREAGLRSRREISATLTEPAGDPSTWLTRAPGRVGQYVKAILGRDKQPIQPLFSVYTRRMRFSLRAGQSDLAEIALDKISVTQSNCAGSAALARVEVELLTDSAAEDVSRFVSRMRAACSLRPATRSKFELGLRAQGLKPIFNPDLGTPAMAAQVGKDETSATLAFAVLREHFARLLTLEPALRLGEDPKAIHRARVAIRRLRSALSLFRAHLPADAQRYKEALRWIAGLLGEVRDLDVQREQLLAWQSSCAFPWAEDLAPVHTWLARQRARAQASLLRGLKTTRYQHFASAFSRFLREGETAAGEAGHAPVRQALPRLIRKRHAKLRKLGDALTLNAPPEDYHALRIRCKRLRYALDMVAHLFGHRARTYLARCAALQDLLGELQDAHVVACRARAWATGAKPALPPTAIFALGALAHYHTQRIDALRAQFPARYQGIKARRLLHSALTKR
jgi:CHAD domain-containing protein